MAQDPINVLFVCLGNICRSPMAEGVFRSIVSKPPYRGLFGVVDSAGTGSYHIDSSPDERTMATLEAHGIDDYVHGARKVQLTDFDEFDYIFAMDMSNLQELRRLKQRKPDSQAQVMLFGEHSGDRVEMVEDPYYGGSEGFEVAYEQCWRFSTNFLRHLFPDIA